jgi:trk system potassium uptake protein TrkH
MVFATMIMVMLGRKISIKGRMLIRESMNTGSLSDLGRLTRLYLLLSLGIELCGALLLSVRFVPLYGWKHSLWMALFHAVSAFCNAGFDLFGRYASLTAFSRDPLVLLTIAALIILGGLGFSVILETLRNRQGFRNLSLHTRIVLMTTVVLLLAGTVFYWLTERTNAETLAGFSEGEKALNAFFQSVTMRTAGFNSFDLAGFRAGSKLFSSFMMMIGASPASTGGGIKTTTIAAVGLLMLSVVRGESEVNVARRRLSDDILRRALAVAVLFLTIQLTGTLIIALMEDGRFPLQDILFEASSAMGTVGVSAIGTPNLSAAARAVLLPMMFLGRVGPLTLAVALARQQSKGRSVSKYPEERIMIG